MQVEVTDTTVHSRPLSSIRWTAILAGLVVGIATHLLFMLLGAAIGLAVLDVGGTNGAAVPAAVGIWNTISMIISAFVAAYVTARSAGMRRTSDGILHGVVSWGVTLLAIALLATTAAGAILGTFFSSPMARNTANQAAPEVMRSISQGDRDEAIRALESRVGVSREQAERMVDQALIVSGRPEQATGTSREAAQRTLNTAALASGWLTGAIVLSLLAAVGGGALGAHGTHRVVKPQLHTHTYTTTTEPPAGTMRMG